MKKIFITAVVLFALIFAPENKAEYRYGGYGFFYTSLAPYGSWIEVDGGLVVWRPYNVRRAWAPYTAGQWIWTSDGWYWDSYESFGYITYHYGRWYFDDYYGWLWVPDYEWAPAWVEWRYDDDYIGWAPLSPYAIFSINIGIHFSVDYHPPYHHWHFVRYRHFCDPYVNKYYISSSQTRKIYSNTRYRTNYGYERDRIVNRGIDVDYVRTRSGRDISERTIERVSDPGSVRNTGGRNSNDRVRTFVATDAQFNTEARDVNIKRAERKTSLETSKVDIGKRNTTQRTSTRDIERTKNDAVPQERSAENIRSAERSSENVRKEQPRASENSKSTEQPRTSASERIKEKSGSTERKSEGTRVERNSGNERKQPSGMQTRETPVKKSPTARSSSIEQQKDSPVIEQRQEKSTRSQRNESTTRVEQTKSQNNAPARVEKQSSGGRQSSERKTENSGSKGTERESRSSGRTR
jgi:hypothetical protein